MCRSEISGLTWEAYTGKELQVLQSVSRGKIGRTKRKASKAAVPVIRQLREFLDHWRLLKGNPTSGLMFPTRKGTPLDLNNILNDFIRPVIDDCVDCGKLRHEHRVADHQYQYDEDKVRWQGLHAFRRGLATNLHELGVPDLTIQAILRHSSVQVTQQAYIKRTPELSVAAMQKFEEKLASPRVQ